MKKDLFDTHTHIFRLIITFTADSTNDFTMTFIKLCTIQAFVWDIQCTHIYCCWWKKVQIINKKRAPFENWKMGRFERVCFQCMAPIGDSARIWMHFFSHVEQKSINPSFSPRHDSLLFFFIRRLPFVYFLFIWFISFLLLLFLHSTFATFIFPLVVHV